MVTAKGPMLPLITPQVWASIFNIKPESGWSRKIHFRQRIPVPRKMKAEQRRPPALATESELVVNGSSSPCSVGFYHLFYS